MFTKPYYPRSAILRRAQRGTKPHLPGTPRAGASVRSKALAYLQGVQAARSTPLWVLGPVPQRCGTSPRPRWYF